MMKETQKHSTPTSGAEFKAANTLLKSFTYAWQGILSTMEERNFKVHCVVGIAVLIMCAVLSVPVAGVLAVVICIGVVMAAEAMNTAIESLVDLASPGIHPLAKRAKDCAAGAVLVVSIMAVVVGMIVFVPPLLALIGLS